MSCAILQSLLAPAVPDARAVDDHLRTCSVCQTDLEVADSTVTAWLETTPGGHLDGDALNDLLDDAAGPSKSLWRHVVDCKECRELLIRLRAGRSQPVADVPSPILGARIWQRWQEETSAAVREAVKARIVAAWIGVSLEYVAHQALTRRQAAHSQRRADADPARDRLDQMVFVHEVPPYRLQVRLLSQDDGTARVFVEIESTDRSPIENVRAALRQGAEERGWLMFGEDGRVELPAQNSGEYQLVISHDAGDAIDIIELSLGASA